MIMKKTGNAHPNLAEKEGSMTYVLEHDDGWKNTLCISELLTYIKNLFVKYDINTPAANRLIRDVSASRNMMSALNRVYSSILAGENLTVI